MAYVPINEVQHLIQACLTLGYGEVVDTAVHRALVASAPRQSGQVFPYPSILLSGHFLRNDLSKLQRKGSESIFHEFFVKYNGYFDIREVMRDTDPKGERPPLGFGNVVCILTFICVCC